MKEINKILLLFLLVLVFLPFSNVSYAFGKPVESRTEKEKTVKGTDQTNSSVDQARRILNGILIKDRQIDEAKKKLLYW